MSHAASWYKNYYGDPSGSMYDACRKDTADYEAARPDRRGT